MNNKFAKVTLATLLVASAAAPAVSVSASKACNPHLTGKACPATGTNVQETQTVSGKGAKDASVQGTLTAKGTSANTSNDNVNKPAVVDGTNASADKNPGNADLTQTSSADKKDTGALTGANEIKFANHKTDTQTNDFSVASKGALKHDNATNVKNPGEADLTQTKDATKAGTDLDKGNAVFKTHAGAATGTKAVTNGGSTDNGNGSTDNGNGSTSNGSTSNGSTSNGSTTNGGANNVAAGVAGAAGTATAGNGTAAAGNTASGFAAAGVASAQGSNGTLSTANNVVRGGVHK